MNHSRRPTWAAVFLYRSIACRGAVHAKTAEKTVGYSFDSCCGMIYHILTAEEVSGKRA